MRLLALLMPLALVIVLMGRLRDPKTAGAIDAIFAPAGQESITPRPTEAAAAAPSLPMAFPGIRDELLNTIEDNTYFRTAEKEAWFHFLELVQKAPARVNQGVVVEYAQLVDQPNVYRGKLVIVRGTARQITQEKPAANSLGLTSYYRVVIQPADGANWPIIVYCIDLPDGIGVGDTLSLDVAAAGLFFKKLSYQWRDGLGIAPVIVAKNFTTEPSATSPRAAENQSQADVESTNATKVVDDNSVATEAESGSESVDGTAAFEKILKLSGWDAVRLEKFDDGQPLSDGQRLEALQLLRRLRSIDSISLEEWAQLSPMDRDPTNADELRGKLHRLVGRVTKVRKQVISAAEAERLEMPQYFECELQFNDSKGVATVLAGRVPKDWLNSGALNERGSADALFVKRLSNDLLPRTLWVAKEIAWHPGVDERRSDNNDLFRGSHDPLLGKSVLGALAVDVGLLDNVETRGRIRPEEGVVFYQMLRAAALVKPGTLVRIAMDNLPVVQEEWRARIEADRPDRDKALAREVLRRGKAGAYSVALLFNDPRPQIGRLFTFDGVARRAVRVEAGGAADGGGTSRIAQRYGIPHYYELEVFTKDSQNYPLIICVAELPENFPTGADIRVPVRVAGFFFKNWLYNTRGRPLGDGADGEKLEGPQAQFAPLIIGRAPIVLATQQGGSSAGRFVLGGLFLLALAGIGAAAAWSARDDRRFRERTAAAKFEPPSGQSLNDLNLSAPELPISIGAAGVRVSDAETPTDA